MLVGEPTHRLSACRRVLSRAAASLALVVVACVPAVALAALPPHVAEDGNASPDACAICHRAHTGNVAMSYRTTASADPTGNALIIAPVPEYGTPGFPAPQRGDVGLCFTCHGGGGLGSQYDVETSFTLSSTHILASLPSSYGPSPKMCSSCHDPHGTDRVSGAPYPKLLRAWEGTGTVLSKTENCTTCHGTLRPS
jgi:cytochrome c553